MGDDRLLQLKRAWKARGNVEDEAAYLVERERCGELCAGALRVLAELGHAAARRCAPAAWAEASPSDSEESWLTRLQEWPSEAVARLFVAALRCPLSLTRSARRIRGPIEQLEAWIVCPCEAHEKASYLGPTTPGFERNARTILPWLLPWRDEIDTELLDRAWIEIRKGVVTGLLGYEPDPVAERVRARTGT